MSASVILEPEVAGPRSPKDPQDTGAGTAYPCLVIPPRKVDFAACQRMRSSKDFEQQCAKCGCPWKNYQAVPQQRPKKTAKTKTYQAAPVRQIRPEPQVQEPAAMPVSKAILKRRNGRLIPVRDPDSLRPVRMNFNQLTVMQKNIVRHISSGLSEARIAEITGRSETFVKERFDECLKVLGLIDSTEGMSPEDYAVAREALLAVRLYLHL